MFPAAASAAAEVLGVDGFAVLARGVHRKVHVAAPA
jgi:hypothetical protein